MRGNGGYILAPPSIGANGIGYANIQFEVHDGTAYSAPATLTVDVTSVNDAPVAVDDNATTNEDTVLGVTAASVLANDTDAGAGDT